MNTVAFRSKLTTLVDEIFYNHERVCVMKNGKKRVVVMSLKEYEELIEYIGLRDEMRLVK